MNFVRYSDDCSVEEGIIPLGCDKHDEGGGFSFYSVDLIICWSHHWLIRA